MHTRATLNILLALSALGLACTPEPIDDDGGGTAGDRAGVLDGGTDLAADAPPEEDHPADEAPMDEGPLDACVEDDRCDHDPWGAWRLDGVCSAELLDGSVIYDDCEGSDLAIEVSEILDDEITFLGNGRLHGGLRGRLRIGATFDRACAPRCVLRPSCRALDENKCRCEETRLVNLRVGSRWSIRDGLLHTRTDQDDAIDHTGLVCNDGDTLMLQAALGFADVRLRLVRLDRLHSFYDTEAIVVHRAPQLVPDPVTIRFGELVVAEEVPAHPGGVYLEGLPMGRFTLTAHLGDRVLEAMAPARVENDETSQWVIWGDRAAPRFDIAANRLVAALMHTVPDLGPVDVTLYTADGHRAPMDATLDPGAWLPLGGEDLYDHVAIDTDRDGETDVILPLNPGDDHWHIRGLHFTRMLVRADGALAIEPLYGATVQDPWF